MTDGKRGLVVAAHPGDFVWRAGGAIAPHARKGYRMKIVCPSFGERGESQWTWKKGDASLAEVKAQRQEEAEAAAQTLGAHCTRIGRPLSGNLLRQIYELARMGPSSGNCNPMRVVFVSTSEGKERLRPGLKPGNVAKTMAAPATAIVGTDMEFYRHIPRLAPHNADRVKVYDEDPDLTDRAAFRNSTLQGAYLIMAARAIGLDCGSMSGFLHDVVDEEFFAGTAVKSNFQINIGHGSREKLPPRGDRFAFDEVCRLAKGPPSGARRPYGLASLQEYS